MNMIFDLLSVGVIGGADGPTVITTAGSDLPLPAICVAAAGIIFILYVYIAKAINAKKAPVAPAAPVAPVQAVSAAPVYTGPVLTGVEEKEAAVIMAIVSHKTGIPLNRLKFESIRLMEDE